MNNNMLNTDNTEVMIDGAASRLKLIDCVSKHVAGGNIHFKNL